MTIERLNTEAAKAALSQITHVYTDVDGTLLAPGGRLLTTHRGKPSLALAKALVRLKRAGIEVIIVTGRDAVSCTEIMRLTNLEQFIAEMGCIIQFGYGAYAQKRYLLGDWKNTHFDQDYDHVSDITPHEMIERSGALEKLLHHFKGKLELHTLKGNHREVTYLLRGNVDTTPYGELDRILGSVELPLQMLDNGIIHPKNHGLLEVDEIHAYHLMPRGTGKGEAVALDMKEKGLLPQQTLALGDAEGDVSMGKYTGTFVLVNDRKKNGPEKYAEDELRGVCNLYTTSLPTVDGWVEFAHALMTART